METEGTFVENDPDRPIKFGKVNLMNPPRRERRGLPEKLGIKCRTAVTGFCGSDWVFVQMGSRNELTPKFPAGQTRLINGHEGVVWVTEQQRYAIVLIRGGDAYDPTRFEGDETYFEYGCDQADGLMSFENYYHPDMLLEITTEHLPHGKKLSRTLAARLIFSDPMACMLFQRERLEDLLIGHNWRVYAARGMTREEAMDQAVADGFARVVIYGVGGAGILAAIAVREKYPAAKIVAVSRSSPGGPKAAFLAKYWPDVDYVQVCATHKETVGAIISALGGKPKIFITASGNPVESEIAFKYGLLDNNGIYASFSVGPRVSFDSMPFGFNNHLMFGAIGFRREHMEEAVRLLCRLPMDELVGDFPFDDLCRDPHGSYKRIFCGEDRPFKSMSIWNKDLMA